MVLSSLFKSLNNHLSSNRLSRRCLSIIPILFLFIVIVSYSFPAKAVLPACDGSNIDVILRDGNFLYRCDGTDWISLDDQTDGAASAEWKERTTLVPTDLADGDNFGYSVAVWDDHVIVGSPNHDTSGAEAGAVYIYKQTDSAWDLEQKIVAGDIQAGDEFGTSVAIYKTTLVVGSPFEDTTAANAGSIYVFDYDGATWSQSQKIQVDTPIAGDQFGTRVAIWDTTIAASAPYDDTSAADGGGVYTFTFDGSTWSQEEFIDYGVSANARQGNQSLDLTEASLSIVQRNSGGTYTGYLMYKDAGVWTGKGILNNSTSMTVHNNTAAAGTPSANASEGVANVYFYNGATFGSHGNIQPADSDPGDQLGTNIQTYGDYLVTSAPYDDDIDTDTGAAYIYKRDGAGTWTLVKKLTVTGATASYNLGLSDVSIHKNKIAIATTQAPHPVSTNPAGAVHIFSQTGQSLWAEAAASKIYAIGGWLGELVGIGVEDPEDAIAIEGEMNIGSTMEAGMFLSGTGGATLPILADGDCAGVGDEGLTRFNSMLKRAEVCDGANWIIAAGDVELPYIVSLTPTNFETEVNRQTNLTMVFNEPVFAQSGNIIVRRHSDNALFESISVGSGQVTGDGTDTIVVDLTGSLDSETQYYVTVADTGFDDAAGNGFEGITGKNTWTFTTENASPWEGATPDEQAKLLASDGASGDTFGYSVSIDGDTAIVGAYLDGTYSGSAYIFTRSGGVWSEQQKLIASDGAVNDHFGYSVSIDGDTVIIGARYDDDSGLNSGSAYVFTRSGTIWSEQQKLIASDGEAQDNFGYNVSIDGNTVVVGVYRDDDNGLESGSAYIFTRSGVIWSEQQKLIASDGVAYDYFGYSVSIDGDTVIIGSFRDDDNGVDSGSAYVFTRDGVIWSEQQKLIASDGEAQDNFGYSVSMDGDTVIIGSFRDDDNGVDSGSAYVFTRDGVIWSEQQKLIASDGAGNDLFGGGVAVNGDTVIIGSLRDDDNGLESGSAYIFTRSGGIWSEQSKPIASDGEANDLFGGNVSVDGNTAIIGSQFDDDNDSDSGSAYIFTAGDLTGPMLVNSSPENGDSGFEHDANIVLQFDETVYTDSGSIFIYSDLDNSIVETISISSALVTGSGTDTLTIDPVNDLEKNAAYYLIIDTTAIRDANNNYFYGMQAPTDFIFDTLPTSPWEGGTSTFQQKIIASDADVDDAFGFALSINGDTAIVGANNDDDNGADSGSAYIYVRENGIWSEQQKLTASDGEASDNFGYAVAIEGDTAVIGAWGDDDIANSAGAVYIFTRAGAVWTEQQKLTASDGESGDNFGYSVDISGLNIVIGAYGDDDNGSASGSAYVFSYSGGSWSEQQKITASTPDVNDSFGRDVAIHGNALIASANGDDDVASSAGAAYIFRNLNGTWTQEAKITPFDGEASDNFGRDVDIYGNTVIAGSRLDDDDGSGSGSAYIFTRAGSNWTLQQKITAGDAAAGDNFGRAVSISQNTVVAGSYLADIGAETSNGAAYIFSRSNGTWTQENKIVSNDTQDGDNFARDVSIDGATALLGAYNEDPNDISDAGSVYVYTGGDLTPPILTGSSPYDGQSDFVPTDHIRLYFNENVTINEGTIGVYQSSNNALKTEISITNGDVTGSGTDVITADLPLDLDDNTNYYIKISENTLTDGDGNIFAGIDDNTTLNFTTSTISPWEGTAPVLLDSFFEEAFTLNAQFGHSIAIDGDTAAVTSLESNGGNGFVHIYVLEENEWVLQQEIAGLDVGASDNFGTSVAIDGDTIAVGAYAKNTNQGAVYVFTRTANVWSQQQKLTASDAANGDKFGFDLTLEGDRLMVSAPENDIGVHQGSVYFFTRAGTVWTENQIISISNGIIGGEKQFGYSIDMDNDTMVVGEPMYGAGRAHVFTFDGGIWTRTDYFSSDDAQNSDEFGTSVVIWGETIFISAPKEDTNGADAGSVYSFYKHSPTEWRQSQKIQSLDIQAGDNFGAKNALKINNNTLLIGANLEDGSGTNRGAVYNFALEDGTWSQQNKIGNITANNSEYGFALDFYSDTLFASSPYSDGIQTDAGRLFIHTAGDITGPLLTSTVPADGDYFIDPGANLVLNFNENVIPVSGGFVNIYNGNDDSLFEAISVTGGQVSGSGTSTITINIGTNLDTDTPYYVRISSGAFKDSGGELFAGINDNTTLNFETDSKASPWDGAATAYIHQKILPPIGEEETNSRFGGDDATIYGNYALISAVRKDTGAVETGKAYMYHRENNSWRYQQTLTSSLPLLAGDNYGGQVLLNNDMAIIASINYNNGAAVVFKRSGDTWSQSQVLEPADLVAGDNFGRGMRWDEDYDTLIISSNSNDDIASNAGAVYVFDYNGANWVQSQKLYSSDIEAGDSFGIALGIYGDTLAVAANGDDDVNTDAGALYIFDKNPVSGLWEEVQKITVAGMSAGEQLGQKTDMSGNTIAIASYRENSLTGAVYVYTKNDDDSNWALEQKLTASDSAINSNFGRYLDLNGNTLAITAQGHDTPVGGVGKLYIFTRDSGTWTEEIAFQGSSPTANDSLGFSVAIHDDKVLVGVRSDDDVGTNTGSVYIIGTQDTGRPFILSTTPDDDATGIAVSSNIVLDFNKNVNIGTGNILIRKYSDDSVVQSISVQSSAVSGDGTSTITINPPTNLAPSTAYYIEIPKTAFYDDNNYYYIGTSSKDEFNFTTAP